MDLVTSEMTRVTGRRRREELDGHNERSVLDVNDSEIDPVTVAESENLLEPRRVLGSGHGSKRVSGSPCLRSLCDENR